MLPSVNRYEESLATHGTTGTTNFNPPGLTNSVGSEWARIGFPNSWTLKNYKNPYDSLPKTRNELTWVHAARWKNLHPSDLSPNLEGSFQPSKNDAWKLTFQPSPGFFSPSRETNIFSPQKKMMLASKYILEMIPKKTGGIFIKKKVGGINLRGSQLRFGHSTLQKLVFRDFAEWFLKKNWSIYTPWN